MSDFINRALSSWAFNSISGGSLEPMIWVTGPRQVGKTFLTSLIDADSYNWDTAEVKKAYLKDPYFFRTEKKTVVFDEIHKRRDWKKILKGYYDSPARKENFVVTGSGRMDQYKKGGDSLQGRYELFHLWPLVYDEIAACHENKKELKPAPPRNFETWHPHPVHTADTDLLRLGGFPKPFLQGQENRLRRWQDQYVDRLVREDVRDLSAVNNLDQLELLARLLPQKMGSPLSCLGLARDIEVSPVAIKSWLRLFEILYLGFLLKPYHRKIYRSVKKEKKWYFYQWTFPEEKGLRFENYMAVQLAAACSAWSEQGYGRWELYYLRDQDRREIDFLIARDLKPVALIEAKSESQSFTSALHYYTEQMKIPGFLVYPGGPEGKVHRVENKGWVVPSSRFLAGLVLK